MDELVQMRDTIESTANDLTQITCILELLLNGMYSEGEDTGEEGAAREAISFLWKSLLGIRDRICKSCMDMEMWNTVLEKQAQLLKMYRLVDSGYGFERS